MHTPHEVVLFTRSMDDSDTAARLQARAATICPQGAAEVHGISANEYALHVEDPTEEEAALLSAQGWEQAEVVWSASD